MVEAMDNGKPIRETRDADVPIVVRHFYHLAGWAQLMEHLPQLTLEYFVFVLVLPTHPETPEIDEHG